MNSNLNYILLILFCNFASTFALKAQIIPTPQQITYSSDTYEFKKTSLISLVNDQIAQSLYAAEIINTALSKKSGILSYLEVNPDNADILLVLIDESRAKSYGIPEDKLEQAYRISISPTKIVIEAPYPQGVFYGAVSLQQLIEQSTLPQEDSQIEIDCQIIIDWPDFQTRGISDDLSHGQLYTVEGFEGMIRYMARHKMNTYLWYIEDILSIDKFATLTNNRDALTKEEVQKIVLYAQKHFIEVIPVFSTLGHHETILANNQFQHLGEFPGASTLCPTCPEVYTYLEDILSQISELFPSEYIHIGGQANQEISYGKSAKLVHEIGLDSLHLQHYRKVYNICKKYGKEVMMYQDLITAFPQLAEQLPGDIIYTHRFQEQSVHQGTSEAINSQGENQLPYYVSSGMNNTETTFPLNFRTIPNIQKIARNGLNNSTVGIISANSDNQGSESFKELLYYGYTWTAQCAWNTLQSRQDEFNEQFFRDFFKCNNPKLKAVYQQFTNPVNIVTWQEIWQHPLIPLPEKPHWFPDIDLKARADTLYRNMGQILQDLDSLEYQVGAHAEHIDVLRVIALINQYFADKIRIQLQLQKQMKEGKKDIDELVPQIGENIVHLQAIQKAYENTWTSFYREKSLKYIINRFKRLTYYLQESLDGLLPNRELTLPFIQSKWIYNCTTKGDTSNCTPSTIFRKDFNLSKVPKVAYIQVIADSYAEIYINGKEVDKIFVRARDNLFLEENSIQIFKIQNYLLEGDNTILIKTINYGPGSLLPKTSIQHGAGVNASVYIKVGLKTIEIQTDESWLAQDAQAKGVNSWDQVTIYEYPHKIIAPNFPIGRTSRFAP